MPQVYDPETDDGRVSHHPDIGPGHDRPSEDSSDPRGELQNAEENPDDGSFYNENGDGDSKGSRSNTHEFGLPSSALAPSQLKDSESGAGKYNPYGDEPTGRFAGIKRAGNRLANIRKKWLLVLAGGGGFMLIIIAAILLLASSLKLPHFAENMVVYQFARVTRQMMITSQNLTNEKLAIDAADNTTWARFKDRYASGTGKAKDLHDKLTTKYSPNKIVANYGQAEHFKIVYSEPTLIRGARATAVILDGKPYGISTPSGAQRFIPGAKLTGQLDLARTAAPYLNESLKLDGYGPIMRHKIAAQMRAELKINLIAWKYGQYRGLTPDEARLRMARDLNAAVMKENAATAKTAEIKEAAKNANDTLKEEVQDDGKLRRILDNRGVSPTVVDQVDKAIGSSGGLLKGLVGIISPAYSIGLPVCLIFDGSLQSNTENMTAQQDQVRRTYYQINSAASQQKYGFNAPSEGIGALNDQLGDISTSNSELRANNRSADTSSYQSVQASPIGDVTIFDATLGTQSAIVGKFANSVAENACPVITQPETGLAIGALALAACGVSAGAACGVEKLAERGVTTITGRVFERIAVRIAGEQKGRLGAAFGGVAQQGAKNAVLTAGAVVTGTIIAKQIVYSHANQMHNGLQSGSDLANDADNGANLQASEDMRKIFYGRPLTDGESASVINEDRKAIIAQNQSGSVFERYASINNVNSLASRLAMSINAVMSRPFATSLAQLLTPVMQPVGSIGAMASTFTMPRVLAADGNTSAEENYGNVYNGWSASERKLLENDPSYKSSLANQKMLDDSGREEEINARFEVCFTKPMAQLLTENGPAPYDKVPYIVRDSKGNVIRDQGLCSPDNLSFESPDPLGQNTSPETNEPYDLIFRWRVAHSYTNVLDDKIDKQEITERRDAVASTSNDEGQTALSDDAQALAKEILANTNISFPAGFGGKEDVQRAADGKTGTNGKPQDPRTLQIIAALGKKHKVTITGLQDNGRGHSATSAHYTGKAVDIDLIDGQEAFQVITRYWDEIKAYSKGAEFMQGQCPGVGPTPAGMKRVNVDACNHLHIEFDS
jgi:hypothetical protein